MADIPGIRVTDTIVPTSTSDTYPTHEDVYGRGGLMVLSGSQTRSAIPTARLKVGMLVRESGVTYRLTSATPVTWVALPDEETVDATATLALGNAADAAAAAEDAAAAAAAAEDTAAQAASDASAALVAADAAVAAADSFPVSDYRGAITSLSEDPGAAASYAGKWWAVAVTGTMSHGNAGSVVVATGGRILSNGSAWLAYPAAPAYLPEGSIVRVKLAAADQVALYDAESMASEFLDVATHSQGPTTPTAGDADGTEGTTRLHGTAISASGLLTEVRFYVSVAGDSEIRVYSKSGTSFTLLSATLVSVPTTGLHTFSLAVPVEAGQYLAFYSATARIQQDNGVGGQSLWRYDGDATGTNTFTEFGSIQLQLGWTVREIAAKLPEALEVERTRLDSSAQASLDKADAVHAFFYQSVDVVEGVTSPAYEVETTVPSTRIHGTAAATTGTITAVVLWANGAGSMDIRVFTKSGSDFTRVATHTVSVASGLNTITGLTIPVTAGQYVGVFASSAGLGQVNGVSGASIWTYGGDATGTHTFTQYNSVQPQIGWTITTDAVVIPESTATLRAPQIEIVQTDGLVTVYVPAETDGSRCVEYRIARVTDGPTHLDVWRLKGAYLVTRTAQYTYLRDQFSGEQICDDGAWECAIKVSGAADFAGTYHGYEEKSAAFLQVDGVDVADEVVNRVAREFALIQRSTIYHHGTTTNLARRTMTLRITAAGIQCDQRLEWLDDVTLENAYLGMMPIRRKTTAGASEITGRGFIWPACVSQDVSEAGFTVVTASAGGDEARVWGDTSRLGAWMRIETWASSHRRTLISNSPYYNKLYFDHGYGAEVISGDAWSARWVAAIGVLSA